MKTNCSCGHSTSAQSVTGALPTLYIPLRRSALRTRASSIPKWWAISCQTVSATICSSCARVRAKRSCGPWKIVILSGIANPSKTERLASGRPWYRPSMPGRAGSCSTTIATFFICRRKRHGIPRSAFSTKSSNSATGSTHHHRNAKTRIFRRGLALGSGGKSPAWASRWSTPKRPPAG
jgi:hypothetical protein